MKIAINAAILDDRPSGLGTYTLNVILGLSRITQNPLLVFTAQPGLFVRCNLETIKISQRLQPKLGKFAGIYRFFWTQFVLPFRIVESKCDFVYHTAHYLALFTRVSQIMTIHDLVPFKYPTRHILQFLYFKFLIPVFLRKARTIVTVSENTKKDLCAYYRIPAKKIAVVYNGFSSELFNNNIDLRRGTVRNKQPGYILFVGASYFHKNGERVIKAFKNIVDSTSNSLYIVGGRKQYIQVLKRLSSSLGIADRVKFFDYAEPITLKQFYQDATLLLFPSLYEGFGMPPLEAMACGCPVVASNTSSIPEVCGEAALYVNPYDIGNIAEGVTRVLNDTDLRARMIYLGLQRSKLFSWQSSAQQISNIINKAISGIHESYD